MVVPCFPEFIPLSFDLKENMHPRLSMTPDGVSEYTFSNLYLFRNRYHYRVSWVPGKTFIISGIQPAHHEQDPGLENSRGEGSKFFMTPCAAPDREILLELFKTHDYWKGIPETVLNPNRISMEQWGIEFTEDRDNFDYLYLRTDLAELSGKKYHKKRNLVNAFINSYTYELRPLTGEYVPMAMEVLERWKQDKGADGDYAASREALEIFESLKMRGAVYYVNNKPAGWCLGESLAKGRMFAIHFEKAVDEYKGIYQFMNQSFAASLPRHYTHINREQDLGDEGLRQAKMTYRPSGFVRKYLGKLRTNEWLHR
jgi:hypothetical protein